SWDANGLNQPQDITTAGTDIWIVDNATNRVYRYANAAGRLSGSQSPAQVFTLDSANRNPTGLVTNGTTFWVTDDHGRSGEEPDDDEHDRCDRRGWSRYRRSRDRKSVV